MLVQARRRFVPHSTRHCARCQGLVDDEVLLTDFEMTPVLHRKALDLTPPITTTTKKEGLGLILSSNETASGRGSVMSTRPVVQ